MPEARVSTLGDLYEHSELRFCLRLTVLRYKILKKNTKVRSLDPPTNIFHILFHFLSTYFNVIEALWNLRKSSTPRNYFGF